MRLNKKIQVIKGKFHHWKFDHITLFDSIQENKS